MATDLIRGIALLYCRGLTSVLMQITASLNANGSHDSAIKIVFNYVIPIGFLVSGILFTKW